MPRTRVLLVTLGLLASCVMTVPAVGLPAGPEPVGYTAAATGTAVYVGVGPTDIARVPVGAGVSAATVSAADQIGVSFDEFGRKVASGGAGRHTEARGLGLDVNGLVVAGTAEAAAPPTGAPVVAEVSLVNVPDVASASLARGEAASVWGDQTCAAGHPLSSGSGRALGLVLPVAAIDAARSDAITELRPVGDTLSVVAEAHQAASKIRLLPGKPEETTIEILGETVLRARANGKPGGAALEYAAVGAANTSPLIRITRGKDVTQFTSQQVFSGGFLLAQFPVMEIYIGEEPRGFDTAGGSRPYIGADGVAASGVVDLLRVHLITGGPGEALDLRIGHLEAEVVVPAGGLRCPSPGPNALAPQSTGRSDQAWLGRRRA